MGIQEWPTSFVEMRACDLKDVACTGTSKCDRTFGLKSSFRKQRKWQWMSLWMVAASNPRCRPNWIEFCAVYAGWVRLKNLDDLIGMFLMRVF